MKMCTQLNVHQRKKRKIMKQIKKINVDAEVVANEN